MYELWLTYEVLEALKPEEGEERDHEGVLEEGDVLQLAGGDDTTGLSEQQVVDIFHPGTVSSVLPVVTFNSLCLKKKSFLNEHQDPEYHSTTLLNLALLNSHHFILIVISIKHLPERSGEILKFKKYGRS